MKSSEKIRHALKHSAIIPKPTHNRHPRIMIYLCKRPAKVHYISKEVHAMPAKPRPTITIRELKTTPQWQSMFALVKLQNEDITPKQFEKFLGEMRERGYRCVGAYHGRTIVGIMGFWVSYRFWCHKYIDIDNVIVKEGKRSLGIGKKMLAWVEREGKRQKCHMAMLDSYTTSHDAHRFYFREGYCILGYHFTKHL